MAPATATLHPANQSGGSTAWRETVVLENLPLIQTLARPLSPVRNPSVEWRDLYQAGALGLIHAADSYDSAMGERFDRYARAHIEFEMIRVIKKSRARERSLGRHSPSDHVMRRPAAEANVAPLESRPDVLCERREMRDKVARAIARLPVRYGRVLVWHYSDNMSLRQIASRLGVSDSRIGQIRDKALRKVCSELRSEGLAPPLRPIFQPASGLHKLNLPAAVAPKAACHLRKGTAPEQMEGDLPGGVVEPAFLE